MTLPVFEERMFDFGNGPHLDHVDEDIEWFDPCDWEFKVVAGSDPSNACEVACRIDGLPMAYILAQAYHRKANAGILPMKDIWIIHPDGTSERFVSIEAQFDALGYETEQHMLAETQSSKSE